MFALWILQGISGKSCGWGQVDSAGGRWVFNGYLEAYGALDVPRNSDQRRPSFLYSYTTTEKPALNLVYLNMAYQGRHWFAHAGLMGGSYTRENLASEPPLLRRIQEACVGWRPGSGGRLEVVAGVFPSHIGAESARGLDGYTLTRSIQADNSPYYESGIQVRFTSPDGRLGGAFLILNGWQRMAVPSRYKCPALGHSFSFTGHAWSVGSHSFVGPARPDDFRSLRLFHNLQVETFFGDRVSLLAVLDAGWAPYIAGGWWWSPALMIRYQAWKHWRLAFRGEWYQDPGRVITPPSLPDALEAGSLSLNLDGQLTRFFWWRTEFRSFWAPRPLFVSEEGALQRYYFAVTMAVIVHIEQVLRSAKTKRP